MRSEKAGYEAQAHANGITVGKIALSVLPHEDAPAESLTFWTFHASLCIFKKKVNEKSAEFGVALPGYSKCSRAPSLTVDK